MTRPNTVADLADKVERDPATGCLVWTRSGGRDGYAMWGRSRVLVHRWFYRKVRGEPEHTLHHKCWVRACIHPFHLEDLTQAENCRRGVVQREREARALSLAHQVCADPSPRNLEFLHEALCAVERKDLTGAPEEFLTFDQLVPLTLRITP